MPSAPTRLNLSQRRTYVLGGYEADIARNWSRGREEISGIVRESARGAQCIRCGNQRQCG